MCRAHYAVGRLIVVETVDNARKVFVHVGCLVIGTLEEIRRAVHEVCRNEFVEISLFVVFVEEVQTVGEQTERGADENAPCAPLAKLPADVEHAAAGGDHIVDNDHVLAPELVAEIFVSDDRILAVDDL